MVASALKRALDVLLAAASLVVLSPVLVIIALAVWAADFHSPLYIAPRAARGGGTFPMFKFRSMTVGADRAGIDSTSANDSRTTVVGRFIRRFKLDELPELWNVLRGDMSLVGPRPQVMREVRRYTKVERDLLSAIPGVTDLASIVFADEGEILRGYTDPDVAYNQLIRPWKSRLGLVYVQSRSLALDLKLIGLTVLALISRRRALVLATRILTGLGVSDVIREISRRDRRLVPSLPPVSCDFWTPGLAPTSAVRVPPTLDAWGLGATVQRLVNVVHTHRRLVVVGLHLCLIVLSNKIAFVLRFDGDVPDLQAPLFRNMLVWLLVVRGVVFIPFCLYEGLWRYTSLWDLRCIVGGVLCSSFIFYVLVHYGLGQTAYSRSIFVIDGLLLVSFMAAVRLTRRAWREIHHIECPKRVLIYGAGDTGEMVARDMRAHANLGYEPIGFIDDDLTKVGQRIHGIPVLGTRADLKSILDEREPHEVLVTVPTAAALALDDIAVSSARIQVRVTVFPNLRELLEGQAPASSTAN